MKDFADFNLSDDINCFLDEAGIKSPTPVQAKSIVPILEGKSLSILAQTGTGKTLTYLLPLFHQIKKNDDDIPMEKQVGAPRAIILTPTRELGRQVFKVSKSIAHHCKLRIRQLESGEKGKSARRISDQAYDILVCTPGRLMSGLRRGEVKPSLIEFLVLDESDQLLDMGFMKDLKGISERMNKRGPQTLLFSATWPKDFSSFVTGVFPNTEFEMIQMEEVHKVQQTIETFNIYLGKSEKEDMLATFLEKEAKGSGMVFFNRKEDVDTLSKLIKLRFPKKKVWAIHGGMAATERKKAFREFEKIGGCLLASDIVARGLDVEDLGWVLNYDLPFEAIYYIHRCGRTGRNQKKGHVYNFVTHKDLPIIERVNEAIRGQTALLLSNIQLPNKGAQKKTAKNTQAKSSKSGQSGRSQTVKRKKTPRYKKK